MHERVHVRVCVCVPFSKSSLLLATPPLAPSSMPPLYSRSLSTSYASQILLYSLASSGALEISGWNLRASLRNLQRGKNKIDEGSHSL
jgi:hypothetical protein